MFLYIHPGLFQNIKDGGYMFLQTTHYRSRWQIMAVLYRAPFCCMIAVEADCSGIIMIQLEVDKFVSLSISLLEEKTLGLQQGLKS